MHPNGICGKYHSGKPHFGDLEGLSVILAAADEQRRHQQLPGRSGAGLDNTNYNLKVDYDLTSSQRFSGVYTYGKRTQPDAYQVVNESLDHPAAAV
jgi:hypothetical protein